jgi:hypothetical protein
MANETKNLFPLGIATGAAFCDRSEERKILRENLRNGTHTWLWARRRMGKTSLVEQVLGEVARGRPAVPSVKLDLNVVHDAESLESKVRREAARLGVSIVPGRQKPQKLLQIAFDAFRPEFSVGAMGLRMALRPPETPATGISDVLMALDAAARAVDRRGVFVLDEFQQLSSLSYGRTDVTLEGAIRHAVERATHISYVFSGSQRHLLADMFENPDRPLYRHCQKMMLERIAASEYEKFFDKAAKARWSVRLDRETGAQILALTYRHPYYVNALCARLWMGRQLPTGSDVAETWQAIVAEDAAFVAHQVRTLSATQRAMLVGMALEGEVEHPTGREFLTRCRLSASTGSLARDVLETEDLIRQNEDGRWELVDPVMAEYISGNAS